MASPSCDETHNAQWHSRTVEEVARSFSVALDRGLSATAVAERQLRYGPNELPRSRDSSAVRVLLRQFRNPLVWLLVAALGFTTFLHSWVDTLVVAAALVVNVGVGFFQEYRASRAYEALKHYLTPTALVRRNGIVRRIPAREVVPGDIILLQAGDIVPADARVVRAHDLMVNEAALTGEWMPTRKHADVIAPQTPLADRQNMVWSGTTVAEGEGEAIVVAVGPCTQLGRIAQSLAEVNREPTPLERTIHHLARTLSLIVGVLLLALVVLGIWRSYDISTVFLTALALAVAAIPQGLPAAVTVTLARGMQDLLAARGLVRNLLAAETLGSTTTIITDKTGTLTQARMELAEIITPAQVWGSAPYAPPSPSDPPWPLRLALIASDAVVEKTPEGSFRVVGRPLERAIVEAGIGRGVTPHQERAAAPLIDRIQFSSERKWAASLHAQAGTDMHLLIVVGAPEVLLDAARAHGVREHTEPLNSDRRAAWQQTLATLTNQGARVVGVAYAYTTTKAIPRDDPLKRVSLTFAGLLSFSDPIRPDVPKAVREVLQAGVRVIVATGDNAGTALAVARAVGIPGVERGAYTSADIKTMDDDKLAETLRHTSVFARVTPEDKLRMVRVLQRQGEVVAMTGDGVNDAPALKQANIGVAVGSGTAVAQEAADLVLLDDSFATLVTAVRVGRRVMDNIKKIVVFLTSTNFSGLSLVGFSILAGAPLPILPRQLLWTNLVEEGFMSFAYAFEPAEPDVMRVSPRSERFQQVLTPALFRMLVIIPLITSIALIGLIFSLLTFGDYSLKEVRSAAFIALTLDSLLFAFSLKSLRRPLWRIEFFSNRFLVLSFVVSVLLLLIAFAVPSLRDLLDLSLPTGWEWAGLGFLALVNLVAIEGAKYLFVMRHTQPSSVVIR